MANCESDQEGAQAGQSRWPTMAAMHTFCMSFVVFSMMTMFTTANAVELVPLGQTPKGSRIALDAHSLMEIHGSIIGKTYLYDADGTKSQQTAGIKESDCKKGSGEITIILESGEEVEALWRKQGKMTYDLVAVAICRFAPKFAVRSKK